VLTRALDLDPDLPLFGDPERAPLVITGPRPDEARLRALDGRAEVVRLPQEPGAAAALALLAEHGARVVLVEGGPSLNGLLHDEDLVDELNVTVAPALVGGGSARLLSHAREAILPFDLAHLWEQDGVLLTRYVRRRPS